MVDMCFEDRAKIVIVLPLILFFTLLVTKEYLHAEFPYTHDGENHLARFANYKIALKEGQLPPRLAPNLLNHYGYPVFNYNYPLANILSLPFSFLKFNYQTSFKIILFATLVFAGFGVVKWLGSFSQIDKKSKLTLGFGLGVYYSSYYLFNILLFRGNIGEVLAFAIFPWILYWLKKPKFSPIYILIWTAFLLSHNIMAVFAGLVCVALWLSERKTHYKLLKKEVLFFSLVLGVTSWFWLPAIWELDLVAAGHSGLVTAASMHFTTLKQLLFSPLQFGFSYPGSVDTLGFSLGVIQLMVIFAFGLSLFFKSKHQPTGQIKIFFGLVLLTILLQLSISLPIWHIFSILNLLQFPWRLSFLTSILMLPLATWIFSHFGKFGKLGLLLVLVTQIVFLSRLRPVDRFDKERVEYDLWPQTTSTQNENLPLSFKYQDFADWQPTAKIFQGDGEVEVQQWQGSSRQYLLELTQTSLVIEPTAYFLGWQTWATNLDKGQKLKLQYLDNENIQGRLAYELPAGLWLIQTKFTQDTPARKIGNSLSLLALFGVILYAVKYQSSSIKS